MHLPGDQSLVHQYLKTLALLLGVEARWSAWMGLHGSDVSWVVRVSDGDLLVLVTEVFDGGLCEDIEGAPKQDVVCWIIDNMNL